MLSTVRHFVGLLLVGITLFSACKSSDMLPGDYVMLHLNATANLRYDITAKADSIWDGRCPEGWYCLVPGSSGTRIMLSRNSTSTVTRLTDMPIYEAGKGYVRRDSTVVELQGQKILIVLKDIVPHRTATDINPVDKKALVRISFL